MEGGAKLVTGGTDNHLMVIDTAASFELDGREAEEALDRIGITTNKQVIPADPRPPRRPTGVRLGTPACTARGMGEAEMLQIAGWMLKVLKNPTDAALTEKIHAESVEMCRRFPVPGIG